MNYMCLLVRKLQPLNYLMHKSDSSIKKNCHEIVVCTQLSTLIMIRCVSCENNVLGKRSDDFFVNTGIG